LSNRVFVEIGSTFFIKSKNKMLVSLPICKGNKVWSFISEWIF